VDVMNFYTVLAILSLPVTVPTGSKVGFKPLSGYGRATFDKILQDKGLSVSDISG